jgi:NAD(P)-dependent dehydrogenase (short-subunit alcohol dehydrogenase family)
VTSAATLDFDGRVIVVTGAGGGIGRSHALLLARRGARVVVNDLGADVLGEGSDDGPATMVVREIESLGGSAVANTDSVATVEGCESVIATAIERYGRLDGVIHNAGMAPLDLLPELDEEKLDRVVRVHLYGAVHLSRLAWPHLGGGRGGALLYITSGAGLYGYPGFAHYGPAKTALVSLARIVSQEGAEHGIRANALGVGAMTRQMELVYADNPERAEWFRAHMRPEYCSAAAVWLIHPDCPASGCTYEAMGGRVARVVVAETRGFVSADLTPEEVRDRFAEVEDLSDWVVPESAEHLQDITGRMIDDAAQGVGANG